MPRLPVPVPALKNYHHVSLLKSPALATKIMDALKYDVIYDKDLRILDVYSSNMIFSSTLYNYLDPRQHVLMESRLEYSKYITSYLGSLEMSHKFQHFNLDPYQWQSYLDITEKEKIVEPGYESRDHIHSKLLFTGSCHVEGLVMQWMACMGNQNWIQRFGNVRMLLWIPQASALKIMAPVSVRERSKCSIVREAFSDARIVALPNSSKLSSFKEEIIQESIIFDEKDFSNPAYPMALVEFNPKDTNIDDMYTWDFVTKNMMILKTRPVSESIKNLGPGAEIYFKEKLNEKLWKQRVNSLTATDFHTITKVFDLWPFKPDTMIDFLSDERS